jgi:hypothetical protein
MLLAPIGDQVLLRFPGNWIVRFDILDCPIFLSQSSVVLLVANVFVVAVSYVVASMAKTLHRS